MEPKFCCLVVALFFGGTVSQETKVVPTQPQIVSYDNQNYGQNGYRLAYSTDDGTVRQENGFFESGVWMVFWKTEWRDPQGNIVLIQYTPTGVSWSLRTPIDQPTIDVPMTGDPTYPEFYFPSRPGDTVYYGPPAQGPPPTNVEPGEGGVPLFNRVNRPEVYKEDMMCQQTSRNQIKCATKKSLLQTVAGVRDYGDLKKKKSS